MKSDERPGVSAAALPAVEARALSKTYRLYDKPSDRLRELLFRSPRHRDFRALADVSFELPAGRAASRRC